MLTAPCPEESRSGSDPEMRPTGQNSATPAIGPPRISPAQLIAGGAAFVLLTVGIIWYQFYRIQAGDQNPRWDQLRWGYLVVILLCLPVETVVSALRIWLVCRVLEPGVSLWTCIKAEWANVAISVLTPSQSGGGLGQIYMLSRSGASVGTALTISLLSFLGTMTGLLCMGLYSLVVSGIGSTGRLFATAIWSLTLISAAMILAGIWPGLFRAALAGVSRVVWRLGGKRHPLHDWWPPDEARTGPPAERMGRLTATLCDIIYNYRDEVRRFVCQGKASFAWVCLLSLVFLFSRAFIPYLCLRFLGVQASTLGHILEVQTALLFLLFFAPTPGGAGLAEGASLSAMAEILPVGFAPYYTMLWRFSTVYLVAIAGFICLLNALAQDARKGARHRPQLDLESQVGAVGSSDKPAN